MVEFKLHNKWMLLIIDKCIESKRGRNFKLVPMSESSSGLPSVVRVLQWVLQSLSGSSSIWATSLRHQLSVTCARPSM
ncbi:hypothetical protein CEXT_171251 [Caerostris extrusa]|uniref:Uncharacterized protein n=1 Tax=Caerostris extrusa TaxID=172846 RepID=A0AAV4Y3Z2_CAEEX|nr:hypothetical protein CEXT_171251 [Caerostris extrusa]